MEDEEGVKTDVICQEGSKLRQKEKEEMEEGKKYTTSKRRKEAEQHGGRKDSK